MKKILLTAIAALGLLPGITANVSAVETAEDRTGWIIKGCSQRPANAAANTDGDLTRVLDGNLNTYWHSYWSGHDALNHFFYIDRGADLAETALTAVGYTPRQGDAQGNGYVIGCDVYMLDSVEGLTVMGGTGDGSGAAASGGHESLTTFLEGKTPTAQGSFSYDYRDANKPECKVTFETPTAGRYILFVATQTEGSSGNKFANCAEFNAYFDSVDPTDMFTAALDANSVDLAQKMSLIKNVIGGTEMPSVDAPEDLTVGNAEAKAAEVNTALTAYLNSFNGKRITIASTRRTNYPYLADIALGNGLKMNTQAEVTPDAVWEIVMQTSGFKLYNRTTGRYISNGGGIYFPKTNGDGIALAFGNGENGLNVDNEGYMSNLTTWGAGDDGSRWIIEPTEYVFAAPEASTADAPKYYRIVSARWMNGKASANLAVNGENQNGNGNGEVVSRAQAGIPGMYWRAESVDENGGVKLINLTGYELTFSGQNPVTMSSTGATFYLIKQTAEQFAGIEECYAIASGATVTGDNCLDASNQGGQSKVCWNPTQEGRGHGDNGSLWYFILATDSEIATATSTYINNVKPRIIQPKVDESLNALFGEEFVTKLYEKAAIPEFDIETVAGVNAAKSYNYTAIVDTIKTNVKSKFAELTKTKNFILRNGNSSYSNCYMTQGSWTNADTEETYDGLVPAGDATNRAALWAFDLQESGAVKIRNVNSALYVDMIAENNQAQPMTTDGFEYSYDYNPYVPGFNFVAKDQDAINGIHQSDNDVICRWNINNTAGSHWTLVALENPTIEIAATEESHTFTFTGLTLNTHESAADLQITIGKYAGEEEAAAESRMVTPDDDNNYVITAADIVDGVAEVETIREGFYEIIVPAGMFLDANGMPNNEFADTFTVNENGSTTGIEEIETGATEAQTVIYDLQGRRLSAPVKGINIINGKKVLVK